MGKHFLNLLNLLINRINIGIQAKKLEIEKARNIALGTQAVAELYNMLRFNHFYLLKLGATEDIRLVSFKDSILTIGIPKVDIYRNYDHGDCRKVCQRLNQLLVKFLQCEFIRLGQLYYQQCYPNLPRIQFLAVYDHSVELIARIKLNT